MRHTAAIVSLTIALGSTGSATGQRTYTARSLRAATHSAHTADDYAQLARYFNGLAKLYRTLSEDQARLLRQETEHPSMSSKFPTGADTARRFEEYYADQARKAHSMGEKYAGLEREALRATETKESAAR